MKFKNYLNEAKPYMPFKKTMLEKFKILIESDYSEAYESYLKGNKIYRGTFELKLDEKKPFVEFSPKKRVSANIINIYTPIINEHPSWNGFPKRNVICTFNPGKATVYGKVFYVFPKNGTKIGVCPENDIWDSFDLMRNKKIDIQHLASALIEIFDNPHMNSAFDASSKLNPRNLKELKKISEKIEEKIKSMGERKWKSFVSDYWSSFVSASGLQDIRLGKTSLFETLISIFSPKGFSTQTIKDLKSNEYSEIWFDDKYILTFGVFLEVFKNEI